MASDRPFVEARQRPAHQVLGERAQVSQRGGCFLGEVEAVGAPVGCVVATLDEAGRGQLVDQPPERDRREVERLGQFALLDALAALQARPAPPIARGSC